MIKRFGSFFTALVLLASLAISFLIADSASAGYIQLSDVKSSNKINISNSGALTFTPEEGGAFTLNGSNNVYRGTPNSKLTGTDGATYDAFYINKQYYFGCKNKDVAIEVFQLKSGYGLSQLDSDLSSADGDAEGVLGKFMLLKTDGSLVSPKDSRSATNAMLTCSSFRGSAEQTDPYGTTYALFSVGLISDPANGGTPTPGSGGQTNSEVWYDSAGNSVGSYGPSRFKFISPIELLDTTTNTTYIAGGYPRMQGGSSTDNSLFADGAIWLRPTESDKKTIKEKTSDGKCLGIVAATFVSGENDKKYGKTHFISPVKNVQTTCTLDGSPITSLTGFVDSNSTLWKFISNQQDKYDKTQELGVDGIAPLMASHYWADKDTIKVVGQDLVISRINSTDERYSPLMDKLKLDKNESADYEFWTTDACKLNKGVTDPITMMYFKKETSGSSAGRTTAFNYKYARFLMARSDGKASWNPFGAEGYDSTWDYNEGGYIDCLLKQNVDRAPLAQAAHEGLHGNIYLLPMAYVKYADKTAAEVAKDGGIPSNLVADPKTDETKSCDDNFMDFGSITCYILKGVDGILGVIEGVVKSQLEVDTSRYSSNSKDGKPLYDAWVSIARISSALLALVAIIMVIGTALGDYKVFSAYSVKKILPRIVIAAVGIWLSWALVTGYIDLMNILGKGIADLLWTPFEGPTNANSSFSAYGLAEVFTPSNGAGAVADFTVIGGAVGAGLLVAGGVVSGLSIVSALIPVAIFMAIGFVVLVVRQALIVFLLALAPIAIVAWVLPNTESIWKKWSKLLNQLLIMFPLFMGVLAAGKIFAFITKGGNTSDNTIMNVIIPVIGYIVPFALLPGLFKSAGGSLSKVTGALSKRGSSLSKRAQAPVDAQVKARRDSIAKERRLQALQNIGKDGGNRRDKWRAGTYGLGSGLAVGGARRALGAQRERVGAAGQSEYNKAQEELVAKELDKMKANGTFNDKNSLRRFAASSNANEHERRAALRRMAEMGDDEGMRAIQTDYESNTAMKEEWNKFKSSSEFYNGFKDKAPDLIKGNIDATKQTGESVKGWTNDTWKVAIDQCDDASQVQHYVNLLTTSATAGDSISPDKLASINAAISAKAGSLGVSGVVIDSSHLARTAKS